MKRLRRIAALAWLLAAAPLDASEFSGFRIPKHRWYSVTTGLSLFSESDYGTANDAGFRGSSFSGSFGPSATWALDADDLSQSLTVRGRVDGRRVDSSDSRLRPPDVFLPVQEQDRQESWTRRMSQGWDVTGQIRRYPWTLPFGFELQTRGGGAYAQEWLWFHQETRLDGGVIAEHDRTDTHDVNLRASHFVAADVSIGCGRVRDATATYSVYVLEKRLMGTGILQQPLSAASRAKLAALYYVEPGYRVVHDRADKFFWREVEAILRDDGALAAEGLDAYSLYRAIEPYLGGSGRAAITLRRIGYFAGLSVGTRHERTVTRVAHEQHRVIVDHDTLLADLLTATAQRVGFSSDAVTIGGGAEFHRPFGPRWQLDLEARATSPTDDLGDQLDSGSSAIVTYVVADRWVVNGSVAHARLISKDDSRGTPFWRAMWNVGYGGEIGFYVEDRIQLSLSARGRQAALEYSPFGSPVVRRYDRTAVYSLGVSYHFLGGLDVPGLIEPVRLLR